MYDSRADTVFVTTEPPEYVIVHSQTESASNFCGLTMAENDAVADVEPLQVVVVSPETHFQENPVAVAPLRVAVVVLVVASPEVDRDPLTLDGEAEAVTVVLDAPHSWWSEIGTAVGTPALVGVSGTQAPPRTNAWSGVPAGAPNSARTWASVIGGLAGRVTSPHPDVVDVGP